MSKCAFFFSLKTEQTPEAQGLSNDSGFGHSCDGDSLSITYKDIEEDIYDNPISCQLPKDYGSYTKRVDEGNNCIVVLHSNSLYTIGFRQQYGYHHQQNSSPRYNWNVMESGLIKT